MPVKPSDIVAVKVRMREKTRRLLEAEAKKAGHSVNQEIVRRIERSFNEQGIEALVQMTSAATASAVGKDLASAVVEHIHNLMRDITSEIGRLDRRLDLHELVMKAKKGDVSDGK